MQNPAHNVYIIIIIMCIIIHIAAILIIAKTWKQSIWHLVDEWTNKPVHLYNGILVSSENK